MITYVSKQRVSLMMIILTMKNGEMNPHRNTLIFNNFDDSTRLRLYNEIFLSFFAHGCLF